MNSTLKAYATEIYGELIFFVEQFWVSCDMMHKRNGCK